MGWIYKRRSRRTPEEIARYGAQRATRFVTKKVILLIISVLALGYGSIQKLWTDTPPPDSQTPSAVINQSLAETKNQLVRIKGQVWTRTKTMSGEQNAALHYKKHGAEFPFATKEDYINAAHEFLNNPPMGSTIATEKDGDIIVYDPAQNWFAVMNKKHVPRTFFKPDPKIHGFATNDEFVKDSIKHAQSITELHND